MSNYAKIVDYAAKDSLLTGNPSKIVKGTELGAEFDAIAVAVATKANSASPVFTGVSNFAAGTVGAPSIYLSTDTTTGWYRIGANNLGLAVSGVKVLDIASTGLAVTGITSTTGSALVGTSTTNTKGSLGLTINQGAADDEIFSMKSSDVAHGMTTITETDTYGYFTKASGTAGGLLMYGFSESATGIQLTGFVTTEDATRSTASVATITFGGQVKSGTSAAAMTANRNILNITDGSSTRFIFDSDGDSHQDVGTAWTNFDHLDDIATLDAISYNVARADDPIKRKFGEWMIEKRESLTKNNLVTFNDDGHHFVNMSKLSMLNTGAIRQLGEKANAHEQQIKDLIAENVMLKSTLNRLENRHT